MLIVVIDMTFYAIAPINDFPNSHLCFTGFYFKKVYKNKMHSCMSVLLLQFNSIFH